MHSQPVCNVASVCSCSSCDAVVCCRLDLKKLRERAAAEGVDADKIEDARDGEDPKAEMIELIVDAILLLSDYMTGL